MSIQAKFIVNYVKTSKGWTDDQPWRYAVELTPVTGETSEENKQFFHATPSGRITISTVVPFEPGAEYYVTFEKA